MGYGRLRINILVNDVRTYGEPWSPDSNFLAGTEESVVWWAKILSSRENEVKVFYDGKLGTWDGVEYLKRSFYESHYRGRSKGLNPDAVTLNIKCPEILPKEPTAYFTNELDAKDKNLRPFDAVIVPSHWAKDNLSIGNDRIEVVPHGYDPTSIKAGKKVPKQVLYCSSPDRGLATLLQAWPEVVKYHPDAILLVTYGFKNEQHRNIPNLIALGEVDDKTMGELLQSSDIWCHPANGGELFCMAGVKAQVAGCVPVYFPTMALSETVRHGIPTNPEHLVRDLVNILGNERRKDEIRADLAGEHYDDWVDSTLKLEAILRDISQ